MIPDEELRKKAEKLAKEFTIIDYQRELSDEILKDFISIRDQAFKEGREDGIRLGKRQIYFDKK